MRRWPTITILLLLTGILLASCAAGVDRQFSMRDVSPNEFPAERPREVPAAVEKEVLVEAPMASSAGTQLNTEQLQESRMIIYNASMFLVVEDTEQAASQITEMATSLGGYVASINGFRRDDNMVYDITIRLPAERFETGRTALRQMAVRVEHESLSTDDVTDQYYDIDARLQTLKATEAELTQMLEETQERGGDVDDVMKIYDRLINLRSEIEALQGQLNRLDKLVAFSTIEIHLEPYILAKPLDGDQWRPAEIIRSSIDTLLNVLAALATLLIQFVIILVPILLLLLLPLVVIVWLYRRWRSRRREEKTKDLSE